MPERLPPRRVAGAALALRTRLRRTADAILPSEVTTWELSASFFTTRLLGAMAHHGIADDLDAGPATAQELAARKALDADALHRVLRALAVSGVVRMDRGGRFRLTRVGRRLRRDDPRSMRDWVLYLNRDATQAAWAGVIDSVRTGEPAFPAVHGTSVWQHFAENPEEEKEFAGAMRTLTEMIAEPVVQGFPWPQSGTVCDVAGGVGTLLTRVLLARPDLRGILVDAPGVLREAASHLERHGIRDRVELSEGDIFTGVEARADVYVLKDVLHDWDDERCRTILGVVRAAMPSGSRVVLVETLQEPDEPDPVASLVDVHMLAQCDGGRQRSARELQGLLRAAGLEPGVVRPTVGPALVEGVAG
jgi:hypothetical protein